MIPNRTQRDLLPAFQYHATESVRSSKLIRSLFAKNTLVGRGVCVLLLALSAQYAQAEDALQFFKNYFVTGDYVVGGVALRGQGVPTTPATAIAGGASSYATGVIHMNGTNTVPAGADIVAAYLYWEIIRGTAADPNLLAVGTFRGNRIVGKQIAGPAVLACFGSGGGSGGTNGATPLLVFRADVLKYLPFAKAANGQPIGQRLVNDFDLQNSSPPLPLTTVSLADSGGGGTTSPGTSNQAFLTEGASLVVVYRVAKDPLNPLLNPLRAVVIYDGGFTFSSNNPSMTRTIKGFYQASTSSPTAKMTHIVGNGRNFQERLYFRGTPLTPENTSNEVPSANNPFPGSLGSAWDNLTVHLSSPLMPAGADSVDTSVGPGAPSSVACISWGAILFSTTVQDSDGDGLLDEWELHGLKDLTSGAVLVDLPGMGADPNVKDVFIEVDYLQTGTAIGPNTVQNHTHKPTQAALDMVGDAFKNAPVDCPPLPSPCKGIKVHFDIGNNYQGDQYVIPTQVGVVPIALQGGEVIGENCSVDLPPSFPTCAPPATQFPDYPGTVTWKTGFNFIKNGVPLAVPPVPGHFDHNRKDIFHYALFAHTLGLPKWWINDKTLTNIVVSAGTAPRTATVYTASPHGLSGTVPIAVLGGLDASGAVVPGLNGNYPSASAAGSTITFSTTAAAGTYNNYGLAVSNGVPRSNSGQSDLLGGDLIVTLGRWDDFIGTEYMQASTLMHELGHNLSLRHGGTAIESNCKPNYQSIMSYLFQVRGLLDASGVPHVNYSDRQLASLNEGSLSESVGLGVPPQPYLPLPYLPRWFAPLSGSFLDSQVIHTTKAAKHCDGTPLNPGEPDSVRIDGTSLLADSLDWNADTFVTTSLPAQDINLNGATDNPINGFNDWAAVDLRQIGSRRGPIGYSVDVGPSDDIGAGGGAGNSGDLGAGNSGDLGAGNSGDLGSGNGGDLGSGNSGDLGSGNGGDLGGDLDSETAETVGNAPHSLSATKVGSGSTITVDLKWSRPTVGRVINYQVWRAECPNRTTIAAPCKLSPSIKPFSIAPSVGSTATCGPGNAYNYCDGTTKNNTIYLYFVTATIDNKQEPTLPKQSGASNIVVVAR